MSVIWTSVSSWPIASSTSFMRSWVSGRGGTTPCWAKAMAVASTAPIQIGRYRSPETSRSSTIGWLDGISTRTPMTSTSRMSRAYLRLRQPEVPRASVRFLGLATPRNLSDTRLTGYCNPASAPLQAGLHQGGVEADREGGDLRDGLLGAGLCGGVAAALLRGDDLLDQADLA